LVVHLQMIIKRLYKWLLPPYTGILEWKPLIRVMNNR